MSFEEINPVYAYILLCIFLLGGAYYLLRDPPFNPPVEEPKFSGDLTLQQLSEYNGVKRKQIFVALKGVIYDVTKSPFYQPDSAYGQFAGYDASINLSKMLHDHQFLNKWGSYTMTEDEQKQLNDWVLTFGAKYRKVGNIKN